MLPCAQWPETPEFCSAISQFCYQESLQFKILEIILNNTNNSIEPFSLNCLELQAYQPNRYPFLMIDHVDEVLPGKYARGYKNLTMNEWYFPVHFPDGPNMPGALQLEALAQMLTVAITTLPGLKGKVTHALQHTVRFRKEVLPGKKFEINAEVISSND